MDSRGTLAVGDLLRSALGRRLLGLFALCSLLPIVMLALLADVQVAGALREARQAELAQAAKSYGLAVFERLQHVDAMLRDAAAGPAARTSLAHSSLETQVGSTIDAAARFDLDGNVLEALGDPLPPLQLDAALRNRLTGSRSVVQLPAADGGAVVLLRQAEGSGPPAVLAAAVTAEPLWGDAESHPVMTRFCVVAGGRRLSCPNDVPAEAIARAAAGADASPSSAAPVLAWTDPAGGVRARAWSLFVRSRFAGDDWTVLAFQPEAYTLEPTRSFRTVFIPLAAAALVLVLLLAARQVGRITAPIHELLGVTQRLAAQDFTAQVPVRRDDEFGQLAGAFNDMAARLALQFGTMKAMASIDRAILNAVDLGEVARNSIRCVRHIVAVDVISVGLVQPDDRRRLIVHSRRRGAGNHVERIEIDWSDECGAAAVPAAGRPSQLPPAYLAHLNGSAGQPLRLRVLPVARGGSFWGVVVLGEMQSAGAPHQLSADGTALLSGLVDRLAVALSTAARDWRLHVQAHFDALTGLPNRHNLLGILTQKIAQAKRDGHRGAVLFLDLDRFKETNDTLGHAAGDELLRRAAERIRLALRESDTVARIGGDEFTVVLPRIDTAHAAGVVANQVIGVLARPFELEGQKLYAGGSVGIAVFPDDGESADEVLKRADTAMYRAKEQGRGRFAFFKESMGIEVSARATLDRELRQALERREFALHYQPQVDVATGALTCVEALLRWHHPRRGLLGPGEFIELAEESSLIESIGAWVLREACAQHRRWEQQGIVVPRVAVNVSNRQLRQPDFVARVDRALLETGRRPQQLEVEVTESMFLDGGEGAVRTLRSLEAAGVRVAIDDFGTGYSSLSYLRTIPATILKVDRSFVVDLADDPAAETIAAAIVNMARTLRKEVVIEGVETAEQLEVLARIGCDRIQGYLVSRPLPAPRFEEFVQGYRQSLAQAQADLYATTGGGTVPLAAE